MLSNTLSIIEKIAKANLNNNVNILLLIDFFKNYKKNMWIYPGTLKRNFNLSISEIYKFLLSLENEGIVKSYYELYCNNCQKSMGTVSLFNEIPEFFECELCHNEISGLENSFLIYKVVRDD